MEINRSAGVLMPVFSLFSEYGIGDFGEGAYFFVDWLKKANQKYWQILPLGQTSFGDSPYQSFSTFAGNPYFISPKELVKENLLTKKECDSFDFGKNNKFISYEKLFDNRFKLLKIAFGRSNLSDLKYQNFLKENKSWLDGYALFMAIKNYMGQREWLKWEKDIRIRKKTTLEYYRNRLKEEIEFYKFVQFLFFKQWEKLKKYANQKGIKIIGDLPIYVAMDSVDVWENTNLFQIDSNLNPIAVAGCPPDGFSNEGQLWGNPLYDWNANKKEGYKWWENRLRHSFCMYDVLRLDHFRGFEKYYSIPYNSKNGVNGKWEKGGGIDFFSVIKERLGNINVIAEDLGFITDEVKKLLSFCGFYGTKVLEFAFDFRDDSQNVHIPHNYTKNSVAYTSTHDNQTLSGWLKTLPEDSKKYLRKYLCDFNTKDDKLNFPLISLIMRSSSNLCIIPMQDYLMVDDKGRINTPSTVGENWRWRISKSDLTDDLAFKIKEITNLYGRNI